MQAEPGVTQAECRFPGEAAQVRAVRRFVASLLGEHWPDSDSAVLLTSELAANAVQHSRSGKPGGKFTVRAVVKADDYFWVEVADEGGPWTAQPANGERGRGLEIVNALASDWGRDGSPMTGWIIWARIDGPKTNEVTG